MQSLDLLATSSRLSGSLDPHLEIVQQNTVIRRGPKLGRMRAGSGGDFPSRRDGSIQPSASLRPD